MSMVRARSKIERFARSALPFCSGVSGDVVSWTMPCSLKNMVKTFDVYSPPPSERKIRSLKPVDLSVSVNQVLKVAKASLLRVRKYTQTHCERSSQKVMRYCAPPEERMGAGPQRSE